MNQALYLARKNYLLTLMKKVYYFHGGNNEDELNTHCRDVIGAHPGELIEMAIDCYLDIIGQFKYYERNGNEKAQ